MPKKKLRDCTYGEIRRYCKQMENCDVCPFSEFKGMACSLISAPWHSRLDPVLDIEIEIPEQGIPSDYVLFAPKAGKEKKTTKDEVINKINDLVREACYGWTIRDGLADREHIEREHKRLKQEGATIIEYIKNHD